MDYELKRSRRARRMTLLVAFDGRVRLTVPVFASLIAAENFLRAKWPWVEKARARLAARPDWLKRKYTKKDFREHKERARTLVLERLKYFSAFYLNLDTRCLSWKRVAIRDQRSRWGSCSKQGNLNFNYKIVFLPADLQDYIIVHELCHLRELNHGKRFWALVALAIPEYNEKRKRLAGKIQ